MKKYEIKKAEWANGEHQQVVLEVAEIGEGGAEAARFPYVCNETDDAPLNLLLRRQLEEENIEIAESRMTLILRGELPVPEGHTLVNGVLRDDGQAGRAVRAAADAMLDRLYSGRAQAMAERDPAYAENRRRQIGLLLDIENRPGFPYGIDLSKLEEEEGE